MGIYSITNVITGKMYIGQSRQLRGRWISHLHELQAGVGSPKLQKDWHIFGAGAFRFEVVEVVTDGAILSAREQHYLDTLATVATGYNTLPVAGSFEAYTPDAEARRKIGAKSRLRCLDPVVQAKMKAGRAAYGYTPSVEHRQKLSASQKGKPRGPMSAEQRAKISAAHKGKRPEAAIAANTGVPHTAESRAKMSAAKKGVLTEAMAKAAAARRGRKHTEEHKRKMSASRKGQPWTQARRDAQARKMAEGDK